MQLTQKQVLTYETSGRHSHWHWLLAWNLLFRVWSNKRLTALMPGAWWWIELLVVTCVRTASNMVSGCREIRYSTWRSWSTLTALTTQLYVSSASLLVASCLLSALQDSLKHTLPCHCFALDFNCYLLFHKIIFITICAFHSTVEHGMVIMQD
jgi:hypothetical protein